MRTYCTPVEADLHNHTTCSDGEYSPRDLVKRASELKLKAVAITDHDTLEGLPEAILAGNELGIEVICGVEVTLRFTESFFRGSLHLLLYFDNQLLENPEFLSDSTALLSQGRGEALTSARVQAINAEYGPEGNTPFLPRNMEEKDVYAHGHRISRRHFALALNDMGITDKQEVTEIIGNDSPAYIASGIPIHMMEGFLEKWPLVRIFAHPAAGSFPGDSHYKEVLPPMETVLKILPDFLKLGLDGFEICYPGHTVDLMKVLENLRNEYELPVVTGGSDCHDAINRPLGICGINYKQVAVLKQQMNVRAMMIQKTDVLQRPSTEN